MALFSSRGNGGPDGVVAAPTNGTSAGAIPPVDTARYELKTRVHRQLIERSIGQALVAAQRHRAASDVEIVEDMLVADETPLSRQEREDLVREVQHETFGLGPIEPLMQDPTVPTFSSTGPRSYQSVAASSSGRTRSSATTPISCRSSTASYRPWAVGSTNRPSWSTPACRTA